MAPHKNDNKDNPGEGRSRSNSDAKRPGHSVAKDSEVYKKRRERNNIAVRKSRQLSRQKAKLIDEKVQELREENRQLEDRVQLLRKELSVLKDLFLSSAAPDTASQDQNSNLLWERTCLLHCFCAYCCDRAASSFVYIICINVFKRRLQFSGTLDIN